MAVRGTEELTKSFMYLAIALILLSFSAPSLYAAINSVTENSARLNAMEIAGVINTMKTSPSQNMEYTLDLPSKCRIDIDNHFVRVQIDNNYNPVELVQTPVTVSSEATIDCDQRTLSIKKAGQSIVVE